MASLILLLSELVRHREPNFAFVTPPSSSCFSSPPSMYKKLLRNDANKYESEIFEEDPQQLRVSVDLVWP
ncbi:hypothetical protein PTKIN_Ptkin01aG0146500 [Pterospermum kingtungense]